MNIRKLTLVLVMAIAPLLASAQTCGLTTVSILVDGGMHSPNYWAMHQGQSGWNYTYEWKVNGNFWSSNTNFMDWPPQGFNEICLTVFATNPTTGDSCSKSYCNIYYSPGDKIYPDIWNVNVNGLDVIVDADFYGGGTLGFITYDFDFGDGFSTGPQQFLTAMHTYASPGLYNVTVVVTNQQSPSGVSYGQIQRKIHVGTGQPNITIQNTSTGVFCDSIAVNISSSPQFNAGGIYSPLLASTPSLLNPSGFTYGKIRNVPGHDYLGLVVYDSMSGEHRRNKLVSFAGCNIIPDTIYGTVYNDLNFNGLKDPGEAGIPNKPISVRGTIPNFGASQTAVYYATTDSLGNYKILVPHSDVIVRLENYAGYIPTYPSSANYLVNFNSGTGHPNFNFGLSSSILKICGRTYLDDNNDSIYNANNDRVFPGVNLKFSNTVIGTDYYTGTNNSGTYCIDVPPGNYILKPAYSSLDSASFVPDSIVINSMSGGTINNRNFGFRSPAPTNLGVYVGHSQQPRPGFDVSLIARVKNTGFLKARGEVVINYPPQLTPISHTPANGILNTTNKTITWITDSINTGANVSYSGIFNLPVSVPLGTILNGSATVTTLPGFLEHDFSNNNATYFATVIGSYDPNDKAVNPSGAGANGITEHNSRLNYKIRFQNTGTASAINVVVMDTLSTNLDMNTLLIERVSHAYTFRTEGRVLIWRFNNINLPDSNSNEALSHGFIEYSINPVPGLNDGAQIKNTADIYFDFNPPVITNTTLNTMSTIITGNVISEIKNGLSIFPNPATDRIFLNGVNERKSYAIFDLTGQQVAGGRIENNSIRITELCSGIYILNIDGMNVKLLKR